MKSLNLKDDVMLREIKSEPITESELDGLVQKTGSYESLLNKRAQKYKALDLKNKNLSEADIRKYILTEYTFLKRPILETDEKAIAGNSAKQVEEMTQLS
jgi:arsenate reductase